MATHVIAQADPARMLRQALQTDAIGSAASGLGLLLAARPVADFMGVGSALPIAELGAGLLVFAAVLLAEARRPALRADRGRALLGLDIAWVVASALIILLDPFGLTVGGKWLVAAMADVVALVAIWKYIGLRRYLASER